VEERKESLLKKSENEMSREEAAKIVKSRKTIADNK
jgi:hypothetical protein